MAGIRGVRASDVATLRDYPHLTAAFARAGWSPARIRNILGENWLKVLKEVWGR